MTIRSLLSMNGAHTRSAGVVSCAASDTTVILPVGSVVTISPAGGTVTGCPWTASGTPAVAWSTYSFTSRFGTGRCPVSTTVRWVW